MALRKLGNIFYFLTGLFSVIFFFNFVSRISDERKGIDGLQAESHSQKRLEVDIDDSIGPGKISPGAEALKTRKAQEAIANHGSFSPPSPESPMYVLILSSLPRSGSTFISEVLANIENSVLFFEPLWLQQKKSCIADEACVQRYLMDIFTCNYTSDFEKWLKSKLLFVHYFNSKVYSCLRKSSANRQPCIDGMNLREMCLDSPVRIIKVIRARMDWLEPILQNPAVNLKVIHLTRDPRGSLNSISKFKTWNQDPFELCSNLEADMESYDIFSERYPEKVLQVSYEKFCLQSFEESANIFKFLYGVPTVPRAIETYLTYHTKAKRGRKNMSTFKDSKTEFEAWRWKISDALLSSVEYEPTCLRSIERMNHTVFGSLKDGRNKDISLFST